jgi:hypothetical protein
MNFNLSNEIYEELTGNKYPTLFEIEIGGKEKIKLVRYEDYKKLENIIKEARETLNTQLAFTSSYQLNYQSAMNIIEEAKRILDKENENE